ncbi:MAG: hypothetical protein HZA04_02970 [Nitrospinae bacterium]|nr:hypothetical protein [Nitrospinota bacterium]
MAELASKYSLPTEVAWEIMTDTLSASLSAKSGCQVVVSVSVGEVRASFLGEGPFPDSKMKQLGGTFGKDLKSFRQDLEKAFAYRSAREALTIFRPLIYRVALGEVVNLDENGGLTVEIENGGYADGKVAAYCDLSDIPLRERGHLRQADRRWFYVKSAKVVHLHDMPRLDVRLSRRSKRLLELLLVNEMVSRGRCIAMPRIRCIHRIPGSKSQVKSSVEVDKAILAAVGRLLGGEIIHVVD